MAVNRDLWQSLFYSDDVPAWPCPKCGQTALGIRKHHHVFSPDAESCNRDPHDGDEHQTGVVACIFHCNSCREAVAVAGNYHVQFCDKRGLVSYYRIKMAVPALPVISIPPNCDEGVTTEIRAAFLVFWSDDGACLNHIRQAAELIMTILKVPKTALSKRNASGRRKKLRLSLHERIVKLKATKPKLKDLCDRLMAVKHLGNAGSHPGAVTYEDVFDGFDIIERILNDLYTQADSALAKIVRDINARRKPRRRNGNSA